MEYDLNFTRLNYLKVSHTLLSSKLDLGYKLFLELIELFELEVQKKLKIW